MKKFLQIALLVGQLVPALIEGIKAIEEALPGKGLGAQKLEAILAIVQGVFESLQGIGLVFDEVKPALVKAVSALVAMFNAANVFKKG